MIFTQAFVVAALVSLSEAHMKLRLPTPFEGLEKVNAPILADGTNYPCHTDKGPFKGTPTKMEKGSKQQLGFTGTAVHGGGSCQISITYDEVPNASSSFKVIHSIQGGCPARNQKGNIEPANEFAVSPDTYDFTIPDDIPSGKATLAWTWFNKIGNREFYMSCAPVEISGSGGSESALASLPDMMIANIPQAGTCKTADSTDIQFPNPGKSVENNGGNMAPPTGECKAGGSGSGSASGSATPAAGAGAAATPAVRGRRAVLRA
ncbi:hypothetical protein C8A01DRAFT_14616 [Parachaetomium inaequale]|uniref:Lytic polysaccharide monooxygenase n=1 Tax=Parachaetomium inaequale TaxID=2588326 RepID=A0AAN6STG0_9PEZI|nr:hypothetical protein C8A01DRAFT_14616 [Parachaetomium inaequale]